MTRIAGLDEAGRGALAGPVVAAVVVENPEFDFRCCKDSKILTQKAREALFETITAACTWGVGVVEASEIDAINIKKATHRAMQRALKKLEIPPQELLIDGNDGFRFTIPSRDIIHGDSLCPVISAASIIAKVWRDRLMCDLDKQYPIFDFATHKGYGTQDHRDLLEQEIYCPEHRRTYEPLKTILVQQKLF